MVRRMKETCDICGMPVEDGGLYFDDFPEGFRVICEDCKREAEAMASIHRIVVSAEEAEYHEWLRKGD